MLEIEIVDSNLIEGGVEVFARAWRDGVQIGFGKDGTVDIERFRIFNPPILVDDPNGTIISTSEIEDPDTGELITNTRILREDPEESLLQSLEQNINLVKNDSSNIISGKIGKTTSTFYPSVDRYFDTAGTSSWSTIHGLSSTAVSTNLTIWQILADNRGGGTPYYICRAIFTFDTSAIGTDTISSATVSLYEEDAFVVTNDDGTTLDIVQTNPASSTSITATDFGTYTFTSLASIALSSISTSAYNNFSLSDTGVVSKTGYTELGAIIGLDLSGSTAPTGNNRVYFESATGGSGTTKDPKLVVEHSAASAGFPFSQAVIIA